MFNLCHLSWTKTVRSYIASRSRDVWRTHKSTVREYKMFNLATMFQPSGRLSMAKD